MYILQDKPDEFFFTENGGKCTPVATLKDEYGGISHIFLDDHCYVLANRDVIWANKTNEANNEKFVTEKFTTVKHWYREAVEAMRTLPLPTNP